MFSGCISKIIHLNYPVPCDSASHVHGFSMPRRENIKQNTYYMHCLSVVLKTRSIGYDSHQQGFMYLNGISLNKPKINIHHFELHHSNLPKKIRVYFWMAMQMMKGIIIILVINHYVSHLGGKKHCRNWPASVDPDLDIPEALESTYWGLLRYRLLKWTPLS